MRGQAAILAATFLVAGYGELRGDSFLLRARPGSTRTPAAIAAGAVVGERFCGTSYCVIRPATPAQQAALDRLGSEPDAAVFPLPFAEKVHFAQAVFDAATGTFDRSFAGDDEFPVGEPDGQFLLVMKSFLELRWVDELRASGLRLVGPMSAMGYVVYGPRTAVASLATRSHVLRVQEIPAGLKRLGLEQASSSSTTAVPMAVSLAGSPSAPASVVLTRSFGGALPPATLRQNDTVTYVVELTPSEAVALSRRPEVVSVSLNAAAEPSDERSSVVIAQGWPASIGSNTTGPPHAWDTFLSSMASGLWPTFDLHNQVIGLFDTGVDGGLADCNGTPTCPPFLRSSPSDICRLVYATDTTVDYFDPRRRGRDGFYHGTMTAALAAGFAGAETAGRDTKRWAFTQGVAQGARVGTIKMFISPSEPVVERNASLGAENRFRREEPDRGLRYGLVALGSGVTLPDAPQSGGPGPGPGARIFNHSWNLVCDEKYEATAILLDQSTRSLSAAAFSFGTYSDPDVRSGPMAEALHVVSMGNVNGACSSRLVNSPATAKNVISVGATLAENRETYAETCPQNSLLPAGSDYRRLASFSRIGWGRIRSDTMGRIKPDLVAPGVRSYGPRSGNDLFAPNDSCASFVGTPPNSYKWSFGTSFAAPAVAGAAALVREWLQAMARAGYGPGIVNPSPAMIKAILVAGAKNLCPQDYCLLPKAAPADPDVYMRSAPDEHQGWGGVSLDRLFKYAPYYSFQDRRVVSQAYPTYTTIAHAFVPANPVSIAVVWTDPPALPTADARWVLTNGLLLEATVTDGNGVSRHYYGNCYWLNPLLVRDGYSLSNVTPVLDRWNNVQRIDIPPGTLPADGAITITVSGLGFNADGCGGGSGLCQDFALAVWNARQ